MKRAILINQVTGPLFIDICNAYSETYEVTLITGAIEPTYAELDKKIKVIYKKKYNRDSSFQRVYTWVLFFFQVYFYLIFKNRSNKYLLVSNPPMLPLLPFFLKKINHFDILIYDVFPDALCNMGYIKKSSFLFRSWDSINRKLYTKAERVITISHSMKKIISRSVNQEKVDVIPPWVDISFIKPIEKEKNWFVKKHNLQGKKIVFYSGNMGDTHDFMTVLKCAKTLQEQNHAKYHFLFIGDGVQKKKLLDFCKKNNLQNITFLPYQESEVLPFSFAAADFGIVTLGEGAENLSVPSKTFYMLSSGCIMISISNEGSEIESLISTNNCGLTLKPNEVNKMTDFLLNITTIQSEIYKINSRKLSKKFTRKNAYYFVN